MTKTRVKFVDMVKGLAILTIAMNHIIAPGILKSIFGGMSCVLLFAFFFYSGYFYHVGKKSIKDGIVARAKSLLVPLFTYSLSFWLIGSVILIIKAQETIIDALCCLRNFFAGSIWNRVIQDWFGWEYHSLGKNYPFLADFWFLPAMFIASILFILLVEKVSRSVVSQIITIVVLLAATGALRFFGISLPYNLQLIPYWTAIILLGQIGRTIKIFDKLSGVAAWVTGILTSVVSIGIAAYFGLGAKMFRGEFDKPEPLMMAAVFLLGCFGTYGVSLICKQIEDSGVKVDKFAYLGSHSLYLYVYHVFIAWIICMITGFSMKYDPENVTGEQLAISIVLAVVSIALSILISVCADKIKSKRAVTK